MNLTEAVVGQEYIIRSIVTDDEELDAFLFTLGCYSGEPITVIARRKGGLTVLRTDGIMLTISSLELLKFLCEPESRRNRLSFPQGG